MKEYFWEYEYPFTEFIKKILPKTYKRKYSLTGNGIYDSYDYSYNSPIVSSQMIDDLFDWIWGVIYNVYTFITLNLI